MGVTVIGGLTMSTLLTLLIVPAAFSLAVGVERWIGPRLGKRLLTYKPGDELGGGPVIEGPTGGPALPPAPGKLGYDPAE